MALEGEQLGFLEKTVKLIEKYGLFKIFKALCVIAIFIYVMCNGANLIDGIVGRVTKETMRTENIEQQEEHDAALKKRMEIRPEIYNILYSVLNKLNADRVFVIEMHNGTNSVSGLPFLFGEMTYDVVSQGIEHVDNEYVNFSLSRFQFPTYLENKHIWLGTTEELSKIDDKLAHKLFSNDATYIALTQIHGVKNELGFLGLTYCNNKEPKSEEMIATELIIASQKLSTLLDSSNVIVMGGTVE